MLRQLLQVLGRALSAKFVVLYGADQVFTRHHRAEAKGSLLVAFSRTRPTGSRYLAGCIGSRM